MLRSLSTSTALVDVDPPSMPMNPSTSCPGWNVVGMLRQSLRGPLLRLLDVAAFGDVPLELRIAQVQTDAGIFLLAELNGADAGEVLRIVRRLDQGLRIDAFGQRVTALF